MAANSFTSWQTPTDNLTMAQQPYGPQPIFRSPKDQVLSGYRNTPEAQYPDGYLGTITNRRQDKVTNAVNRNNQRSYSRGVHKGERINQEDYFWPNEFNNQTALVLQSKGQKFAPPGAEPVRMTNDGKLGPRGITRNVSSPEQMQIDMERRSQLRSLKPNWR